jgi:hypothetical protein
MTTMRRQLAFELPHTDPDPQQVERLSVPRLDDVLCGLALIGFVLAGMLA